MKTDTLIVKVKPEVKEKAMNVAESLGFSISSLVNAYLLDLIKNETVHFSSKPLEPSDELLASLKESEEERKKGNYYSFDTTEEAIAFLHKNVEEGGKYED
ncbi:MAG: hypothetical protein COU28_03530 [Candidatus Magasanikbacteria bacterium CG10_big_fil_rev_8_21_14_0_10_36_16]|uniref:Type II toxin-antitoxin system antitoxin, RelB/DinJ family n=1 Tax=Candidatus Magasanikbacteria bacterium CG10_big_fil_rev_8_21_14_0_10_36_16 TaxID=1974645 RepID=A0A2H0TXW1_9BACT|nr:MAG: hypothetical protein COU28_03530 [Candidatus Magasanikbacteria bacterium CG10_big_fil_rev_8_21_14_0_10_36_16]